MKLGQLLSSRPDLLPDVYIDELRKLVDEVPPLPFEELEVHLGGELDFREEAHNAELIAGIVAEYDELFVPQVVHPYVTEQVLVLEHVRGVKVVADHGVEPEHARRLARQFFRAYVRQVTIAGLYHADPHAATSSSPGTAGSRSSISACSAGSTTTRGPRSRCSCSRSRRTAPTTSRT